MVFLLPKTFELIGFFQSFDYGRTHVQWKRNQFLLNTKYICCVIIRVTRTSSHMEIYSTRYQLAYLGRVFEEW